MGAPPSGNARNILVGGTYVYGGKNPISNLAFIYTCAETFIVFIFNLMYLYILNYVQLLVTGSRQKGSYGNSRGTPGPCKKKGVT